MTFTILGYRITLFKFEKVARFHAQIDHDQRAQDVKAITESARFQALKEQAKNARLARG